MTKSGKSKSMQAAGYMAVSAFAILVMLPAQQAAARDGATRGNPDGSGPPPGGGSCVYTYDEGNPTGGTGAYGPVWALDNEHCADGAWGVVECPTSPMPFVAKCGYWVCENPSVDTSIGQGWCVDPAHPTSVVSAIPHR